MSNNRENGAKPKDKTRSKKWNLLPPVKRSELVQTTQRSLNVEQEDSLKREINRLEDINRQYETDYRNQRKILLFIAYEHQYLLDTKTNYWNIQKKLISTISA